MAIGLWSVPVRLRAYINPFRTTVSYMIRALSSPLGAHREHLRLRPGHSSRQVGRPSGHQAGDSSISRLRARRPVPRDHGRLPWHRMEARVYRSSGRPPTKVPKRRRVKVDIDDDVLSVATCVDRDEHTWSHLRRRLDGAGQSTVRLVRCRRAEQASSLSVEGACVDDVRSLAPSP